MEPYRITGAILTRYSGRTEKIDMHSDWTREPKRKIEDEIWKLTNHDSPDPVTTVKILTERLF